MTKEEAIEVISTFFKDTMHLEAFALTDSFIEAREVLGGRSSPEVIELYAKAKKESDNGNA